MNLFDSLSRDELLMLVIESESFSDVVRKVGFQVKGQTIAIVRKAIARHEISTEHFLNHSEQAHRDLSKSIPLELVLIENSNYPTARARAAFKRLNIASYECKECKQKPQWRGRKLVLVFDHIDGDNRNHKPSNLRWLCPNCNSQTDTFCGKNKTNPKRQKHSERTKIKH